MVRTSTILEVPDLTRENRTNLSAALGRLALLGPQQRVVVAQGIGGLQLHQAGVGVPQGLHGLLRVLLVQGLVDGHDGSMDWGVRGGQARYYSGTPLRGHP